MPILPSLQTDRLLLRDWRGGDFSAFCALNADPQVARYLPGPLSPNQSQGFFLRITEHIVKHGLGLFALAPKGEEERLIGVCGLNVPSFQAPFTPCVEIGWRLSPAFWNQGLCTEAARAVLKWGFEEKRLGEIVSFTVPENAASRRVMEKLGMTRDLAGDFLHPVLPPTHPLAAHVLYRLDRARFRSLVAQGFDRIE